MANTLELPNWPRRMKVPLAAAYAGVSVTKFLRGVGTKYPQPVHDGKNALWYREDLDEALDRVKGAAPKGDPFLEALHRG